MTASPRGGEETVAPLLTLAVFTSSICFAVLRQQDVTAMFCDAFPGADKARKAQSAVCQTPLQASAPPVDDQQALFFGANG